MEVATKGANGMGKQSTNLLGRKVRLNREMQESVDAGICGPAIQALDGALAEIVRVFTIDGGTMLTVRIEGGEKDGELVDCVPVTVLRVVGGAK